MDSIERVYQDRSWLIEQYVVREESTPVMAKEAKCHYKTILRWLRKMDIPVRSSNEGQFLAVKNFLALPSKLLELLEGELLGDGCISMTGKRSAHYQHTSKYAEYVAWLSKQFASLGLEQTGRLGKYRNNGFSNTIVYHYGSRSYPELVPIRKQWYPNGKKIVPEKLELTPLRMRQWYLGDGSLARHKDCDPGIHFATNGFDINSVNRLVGELQKQGFKARRQSSRNAINLSIHSTQDFLDYIGPCPVGCYDYKWDVFKRDG